MNGTGSVHAGRRIADELVSSSNRIAKLLEKNKLFDRSQAGNRSCLRNETWQYAAVSIGPDFKVPHEGVFEFDFVYLFASRDQTPLQEAQFGLLHRALSSSKLTVVQKIRVDSVVRE